MGIYNITHFVLYDYPSGTLNSSGPFSDVANDGDADTTFESGDTFVISTQNYSYAGQVDVDGTLYPALFFHGNNPSDPATFVMVIMDTAPSSPAGSLSLQSGPSPVCFSAGTQVRSPYGERGVEYLEIGDTVMTPNGGFVPIKWIGRQTVSTRFGRAERLMPVRFAAGSLGDGLPHKDLTVTADHGMLVGGVICYAGALVNGTTITRVPLAEMGETYTVYHIETEAHQIILANGAPSETCSWAFHAASPKSAVKVGKRPFAVSRSMSATRQPWRKVRAPVGLR